ncbi:unnamed protein product [Toxocara canis]|uniref:Uncharacterized protein n=1 Tax=Toxocara canis TaxID=6265 RepID=A0A183V887_TOXCA|nr:unnamed protein product [Toxocara canis]
MEHGRQIFIYLPRQAAYLIVPVIACSVVLISVAVHLFDIALNKCHTHQLYLFVALIGWLIVALALFIIGIKWDESAKIFKMHFGASFPDLWRACDIIAWIYACVNVAQICLIAFYSKLSIRLEKPSTRVTLVLNKSVFDVDEPAYPLNEDWANRSSNKHLWM